MTGGYLVQAEETGTLGLAGWWLTFLTTAIYVGTSVAEGQLLRLLPAAAPQAVEQMAAESIFGLIEGVNGLLFALGWLRFGIAVFRARGLPREGAICAVSAAVTSAFFEMLPVLVPGGAGRLTTASPVKAFTVPL